MTTGRINQIAFNFFALYSQCAQHAPHRIFASLCIYKYTRHTYANQLQLEFDRLHSSLQRSSIHFPSRSKSQHNIFTLHAPQTLYDQATTDLRTKPSVFEHCLSAHSITSMTLHTYSNNHAQTHLETHTPIRSRAVHGVLSATKTALSWKRKRGVALETRAARFTLNAIGMIRYKGRDCFSQATRQDALSVAHPLVAFLVRLPQQ